jgi:hypothetical protein
LHEITSMAAYIDYPIVHVQIPAHIKKHTLQSVETHRIKTVNVNVQAFIAGRHGPDDNMAIARTIVMHYGYLPDGFAKEVTGAEGNESRRKFANIQRTTMSELYGKSSFLYEYIRGEVSADTCATTVTNWDLAARQCEFPNTVESDAERDTRIANGNRFREAITLLQAMVEASYDSAIMEAKQVIASKATKATDKHEAQQRLSFHQRKRTEQMRPLYRTLDLIANARELEQLKRAPLFERDVQVRYSFWKERLSGDVLATMFRLACGVVDLKTLMGRANWTRVWVDKLVVTMDILHRTATSCKGKSEQVCRLH